MVAVADGARVHKRVVVQGLAAEARRPSLAHPANPALAPHLCAESRRSRAHLFLPASSFPPDLPSPTHAARTASGVDPAAGRGGGGGGGGGAAAVGEPLPRHRRHVQPDQAAQGRAPRLPLPRLCRRGVRPRPSDAERRDAEVRGAAPRPRPSRPTPSPLPFLSTAAARPLPRARFPRCGSASSGRATPTTCPSSPAPNSPSRTSSTPPPSPLPSRGGAGSAPRCSSPLPRRTRCCRPGETRPRHFPLHTHPLAGPSPAPPRIAAGRPRRNRGAASPAARTAGGAEASGRAGGGQVRLRRAAHLHAARL